MLDMWRELEEGASTELDLSRAAGLYRELLTNYTTIEPAVLQATPELHSIVRIGDINKRVALQVGDEAFKEACHPHFMAIAKVILSKMRDHDTTKPVVTNHTSEIELAPMSHREQL
mmetsp:Transcript_37061/g.85616  ORF Transcript_37061/g.85616 Transcript_37061/m.85616 type:complete len:116 (-) Transcript_37061:118-465(-)